MTLAFLPAPRRARAPRFPSDLQSAEDAHGDRTDGTHRSLLVRRLPGAHGNTRALAVPWAVGACLCSAARLSCHEVMEPRRRSVLARHAMLGIVLLSLSGIVGCGSGSRSESPPRAPTRSLEDLVAEARARFDTVQLTNDSGREACGVILTFQGAQLPYPEFQPFEIGRQVIVEAPKFRNCQRLGGNELLLFSGAWPAGATASVTFNRSESGAVQIASRRWIAKDETVYFPDPAIRRAVLEAVAGETASSIAGAPEGIPAPTQVLLLDALLLTELDASRRGVTDLRGIDACRSLSRLNQLATSSRMSRLSPHLRTCAR